MTPAIANTYYHTMELPDGLHEGQWDCRQAVDAYLGRVDLTEKTVLEVGPANGFFTFEMERRGAKVTCLDLGPDDDWDMVPGPLIDRPAAQEYIRNSLASIRAAFRHAHELTGSHAEVIHGTIYQAADICVKADIGMLGNVLEHLRDPFAGMMAMAECIRETFIVTEAQWLPNAESETAPYLRLVPTAEEPRVVQTWWHVSSPWIAEALKLLGFPHLRREFHYSTFRGEQDPQQVLHVTWVGSRHVLI